MTEENEIPITKQGPPQFIPRARYLRYKAEHPKEEADQSETKKETHQAHDEGSEPIVAP